MGKLIVANWKEHPRTAQEASVLFRAVAKVPRADGVTVAICPPFLYLEEIAREFKRMAPAVRARLALGAQDIFWEEQGEYTGEIGPEMLRSLGAKYVIIGHSERRRFAKETDAMINKKIALALRDGLKVIICVGESLSVREKGAEIAKKFVAQQLEKDLKDISFNAGSLWVAYEPIWAIGTGRSAEPKDVREMAAFIKSLLKRTKDISPRFLYGGSVNGTNAGDYVQLKEIDGALVGGASLKADEFKKIINASKK